MDQTPGGNPPTSTDTPGTPEQPTTPAAPPVGDPSVPSTSTPPVGDTPASDTPSTPPASEPSGPPPLTSDTPASDTPAAPTAETPPSTDAPAAPVTENPAPADTDTPPAAPTESAASAAPASDTPPAASTPDASSSAAPADPPSHDHKGMSKPLMVTAGLLIVGALSAVMLVANMQPGDTQSSASRPTRAPALPTQASQTAQDVVTSDPNLTIHTPKQNSIVSTPEVVVNGKTFPNAEVFVNELELKANASGVFTTKVALEEGENTIVITANDEEGNAAEQELIVTYETE